jgi:hypothetical protein
VLRLGEAALERRARAVGRREPPLALVLDRRPVGMAGLAVEARHRGVQPAHRGRALDRLAVEPERRLGLAAVLPRFRDERERLGRLGVAADERLEGPRRDRLVRPPELEPHGRVVGRQAREPFQVRRGVRRAFRREERRGEQRARLGVVRAKPHGFRERRDRRPGLPEPHPCGPQEEGGGKRTRVEPLRRGERRQSLAVRAGELERHPEVELQARVAGSGGGEPAVERRGLRVTASGHQLLGALRLGLGIGLRGGRRGRRGQQHAEQRAAEGCFRLVAATAHAGAPTGPTIARKRDSSRSVSSAGSIAARAAVRRGRRAAARSRQSSAGSLSPRSACAQAT